MRGENRLINIKDSEGNIQRISRKTAQSLVASGAFIYVSNLEWRAFKKTESEKAKKAIFPVSNKPNSKIELSVPFDNPL